VADILFNRRNIINIIRRDLRLPTDSETKQIFEQRQILFGERSLRRSLAEYVEHYHAERNHQGKDNVLLFPRDTRIQCDQQTVRSRERFHQEAP
jgi:hypothetical protein